ncbi:unnamed protein product [Vitrella brassicaformis CCMP3155]|uniref:Uncharacterized protein n=1 Tax=Vitrella brassicaformis (strain CCMP3155) TaxID=1169540 RepID=A0A0G4F4G3_VITBC|nr:unnamed protein product [Vitrella brassicaformis CCMP3155]|eukprot:CEM06624.1 unnamed protein product [Vitrella brassicaformis CCMP3155]
MQMSDDAPMDVNKDDGPADSAGGQGGGPGADHGGGSSRNLVQMMKSVASQIVSDLERAEGIIATHADNNAQDGASLAGSLASILETLTDAQSALNKQLAETSTDHITRKTHGNSNDIEALVSGGLDQTDEDAQHSKAVAVGEDGKRGRVDALADASSGDGSVDVCGSAAATQQQGVPLEKDHGRPCLPGLPEAVIGHLGSFLTTIDHIRRLSSISRGIHEKATDKTYGVFRSLTVTRAEEPTYHKIETLHNVVSQVEKTLGLFGKFADASWVENANKVKNAYKGKIQVAHVEADRVPSVASELLEANKDTLKKVTLDVEPHLPCDFKKITPNHSAAVFSQVTHLDLLGRAGLDHISDRCWTFPAVTTLRVGRISNSKRAALLVRLLRESPKIERLEFSDGITFDDARWSDFLDALVGCPHLTTIAGIGIKMKHFGRLCQLKDTLDQNWSKPDKKEAPKKLGFVMVDYISSIGVDYGQGQGAADMAGITKWAADVRCQIEWPRVSWLTIDCSSAATARPAPGGLYGDIATQLAAKATHVRSAQTRGGERECIRVSIFFQVELELGGTALHESWRDKLIFHNTSKLTINIKRGASASAVVDSIPTWLTEREGATSRHLPAVKHLTVRGFCLSLADVRAASSKLSPLVGGLTTLKSVTFSDKSSFAAAREFLCYTSVERLDVVDIAGCVGDVVSEWPADAPATQGVRCPIIHRLVHPSIYPSIGALIGVSVWLSVEHTTARAVTR